MSYHGLLFNHPAFQPSNAHLHAAWSRINNSRQQPTRELLSESELFCLRLSIKLNAIDEAFEIMDMATHKLLLCYDAKHGYDLKEYQYHMETFVSKYVGIVDRSYILVGTALSLNPKKLEKASRRNLVDKGLESANPAIEMKLKAIELETANWKESRHQIAHSSGFTSDEYEILTKVFNMPYGFTGAERISMLRDLYRNTTNELFERMEHLRTSVGALADSLGQSVLEKIAA